MSERTALYRFYDAAERLLYVGITDSVEARFAAHRDKFWWPEVARHTIEWIDTRQSAEAAEKAAMREERPLWNVQSSPWIAVTDEHGDPEVVARPTTRSVAIRVPDGMWEVHGEICQLLDTNRTADIVQRMCAVVRESGTASQIEIVEQVERAMTADRERRARKGGRPRTRKPASE